MVTWPPHTTVTWCPMCGEVVDESGPAKVGGASWLDAEAWEAARLEMVIETHMLVHHRRRFGLWKRLHWNWLITWPRKRAVSM